MEITLEPQPKHFISTDDAKILIQAGNKGVPRVAFANKKELKELLNQEGCVGVKIYHNDASADPNPVIIGFNAKGEELKGKILGWLPTSSPSAVPGLSSIVSPS